MTKTLPRFDAHIAGRAHAPAGGVYFETINPYTSQPWAEVARCAAADVDLAVDAAHHAFLDGPWPRMAASARGALLCRMADVLAVNAKELAAMEVRDNGKLISEMAVQCAYLPQCCRHFWWPGRQNRRRSHPDRQTRHVQFHPS